MSKNINDFNRDAVCAVRERHRDCTLNCWECSFKLPIKIEHNEEYKKMEEITTNAAGGKQHKVNERCEALFFRSILKVAELRAHAHDVDGYDDDNYLLIEPKENVGRAFRHICEWYAGNAEDGDVDDHLVHAACRIMMALETILIEEEQPLDELDEKCVIYKGATREQ